MARLKMSIFALITFVGISIGANNMTKFQKGRKFFNNRANYCEWIDSSDQTDSKSSQFYPMTNQGILYPTVVKKVHDRLWNLSQKLTPYRSKKIPFTYLPQPIRAEVNKTLMKYQKKLNHIKNVLSFLAQNSYKLKNNRSEDKNERRYQQWKLDYEYPNQITHLNAARSELEALIADLKQTRMNDLQAYQFFRQAFFEDIHLKETNLPFLALELEYQPDLLKESVNVYPVWLEKNKITRASKEPYFSVSGDMIPSDFGHSLRDGKLPKLFYTHIDLLKHTLPFSVENSKNLHQQKNSFLPEVQVLSKYRLLIKGTAYSNRQPTTTQENKSDQLFTSASNLALDGLLDLGCIQNSHWSQKLIKDTEKFLTDPQLKSTYTFESIDSHNLQVLKILKTLGSPTQRYIAQVKQPLTFWDRFLFGKSF